MGNSNTVVINYTLLVLCKLITRMLSVLANLRSREPTGEK